MKIERYLDEVQEKRDFESKVFMTAVTFLIGIAIAIVLFL